MAVINDSKTPSPEAQLRSCIGRLDPKVQKLFRSVRAALRKRFPTANELAYDYSTHVVVAYCPTEQAIESILAIDARADGVRLYLMQAPKLPDPKKLLSGSGKQARFVPLEAASRLSHPDVRALITAATARASAPLPTKGNGRLIIKSDATKKRARGKTAK